MGTEGVWVQGLDAFPSLQTQNTHLCSKYRGLGTAQAMPTLMVTRCHRDLQQLGSDLLLGRGRGHYVVSLSCHPTCLPGSKASW